MRFITGAAIRRPSVTLLGILILIAGGVFAYKSLHVELFPEIEFPLVTVNTVYMSAGPETVVRDVTAPVERAISGIAGLESVQSTSFEGNSLVLANFTYGTDMDEAENSINSALQSIAFPTSVDKPTVGRFNPSQFPVIQFSVISDEDTLDLQQVVDAQILPAISGIDGIMLVQVAGKIERRVEVTVDPNRMAASGVSLFNVSSALSENNLTLPAGLVFEGSQAIIAKTTHTLNSVEGIEDLIVGATESGPVRLGDVADVSLGMGVPTSISRTNGKPAVSVSVLKTPEANTIDVTSAVQDALDSIRDLPPNVDIVVISDQGPAIQGQIDTLLREAMFGFLFAVSVVFAFMLTIKPTPIRGMLNTLRPTIVIGLSIPLSVLTGVVLMAWQDMTLNFMTLGGLAISVGRVVDDSIVVLENVYRHVQGGRDRWRAALDATMEVGPAIFASTMTTVVVFLPLAFIQGLVGAFFLPFALTVTFALLASLVVALTAVPVLAAYLLRPGDLPEGAGEDGEIRLRETWMQRAYTPILKWALRHRIITLLVAGTITVASLGLTAVIPVTLFPGDDERFLAIEVALPPGTPPEQTIEAVMEIEERLRGLSDTYTATVGASDLGLGGIPAGFNKASILAVLREDAPSDVANRLRSELDEPGRRVSISEIANGPPSGGVEVSVTGPNYDDIAVTARELTGSISALDGVVNVSSNVAQARDEISIEVDPESAALIGLNTRQVGIQLSQYLIGQTVTSIAIDGEEVDVVLRGDPRAAMGVDGVKRLPISGPLGSAPLSQLANIEIREGPVTISRTDGSRSATITGDVTSEDTQAVGVSVDEVIQAMRLPRGVEVSSGGVFADIAEGFQAIFISVAVGIVLVYLVMVVSLGSLRNPVVIVLSMPLALIGVLAALALTGRTLGLPAMMGVLLLIGIVVTNAIVLISYVEQLRSGGMGVYDALIDGSRVRLRPILMTALTTSFSLLPLAAAPSDSGGIIGAELATVVIGGLMSSTALTLIVVPVVYTLFNESIPNLLGRLARHSSPETSISHAPAGD